MTQLKTATPFSSSPIQVGLVGTGYAATRRAEAFQEDDRAQLVAVVGHTPEKTAQFCQTYNVERCESWQKLVEDRRLEAIAIASINRDRGAIARSALEAGKHVIVEYPLSLDPAEASDLIELAKDRGKLLHIEHIELLGGLHQALRQALPAIGNIFYARYTTISSKHPAPRRWSYNHHLFGFPLSAALSRVHRFTDLFGTVASVSCQARFWDTSDGYYSACLCDAQLRFHNDLIADITYGKGDCFWRSERTFELHGDRGTLIFDTQQGTLIRGDETTPIEVGSRRGLFAKDTTLALDAIINGKPLYISPQASAYALKVADAARISAETGQTYEL
ncbi:Gfo/Idh/MocA family oxidoreductase [Lusitaniella coriacea LEGE 07157]|uniref:Gfo/Idh/MocA family oxidoreductase n=1 Tax=Lusitaniella coriacea LEGE 07157 TaxID=945747 RepID=A0A8J7B800_9CYAN|nr:Gfo/Idh/MocA family oxidoreductase [Lusitaniella coriacea]MBE9114865.1 Gfo/Idh/MocA family oxidoreductase [Lusitaniella coriacea LEGE 07157]